MSDDGIVEKQQAAMSADDEHQEEEEEERLLYSLINDCLIFMGIDSNLQAHKLSVPAIAS